MKELLSKFLDLDYDVVGDYLDYEGNGRYRKKYIKRYKVRRKGGGKWRYLPML